MIATPLSDAQVNYGQIDGTQDAQCCGEPSLCVSIASKDTQDYDCGIDQDAQEQGRQPGIPSPINAPGLLCPERATRKDDETKNDCTFCGTTCPAIPGIGGTNQICSAADAADYTTQIHGIGGRHVKVEDLLRQSSGFWLRQWRVKRCTVEERAEQGACRHGQE